MCMDTHIDKKRFTKQKLHAIHGLNVFSVCFLCDIYEFCNPLFLCNLFIYLHIADSLHGSSSSGGGGGGVFSASRVPVCRSVMEQETIDMMVSRCL